MSYGNEWASDIREVENQIRDERYDRKRADDDLRREIQHIEGKADANRENLTAMQEEINELREALAMLRGAEART